MPPFERLIEATPVAVRLAVAVACVELKTASGTGLLGAAMVTVGAEV